MRSLADTVPPAAFSRRFRRRVKRPVWSARSFTIGALLTVVGVAVPVLILGERSLLVRAEWATTIVAAILWLFLFVGLYLGVRVRRDEPTPKHTPINADTNASPDDAGSVLDKASSFVPDLGDDLIGGVVALIFWIVVGIVLILCVPMLLEGLWYILFTMIGSLSWIFRRALRQVFIRGPRCRGRMMRSLGYASGFTVLYAGWLLAILSLAHVAAR